MLHNRIRLCKRRIRPMLITERVRVSPPSNGWSRTLSNTKKFPEIGFVRLPAIIAPDGPIPVSKSTWWDGIRTGRFPKPVKLGPKATAWRVEDIRELIKRLGH